MLTERIVGCRRPRRLVRPVAPYNNAPTDPSATHTRSTGTFRDARGLQSPLLTNGVALVQGGSGAEWDRPLSSLPPTPPDHRRPRVRVKPSMEYGALPPPVPWCSTWCHHTM